MFIAAAEFPGSGAPGQAYLGGAGCHAGGGNGGGCAGDKQEGASGAGTRGDGRG